MLNDFLFSTHCIQTISLLNPTYHYFLYWRKISFFIQNSCPTCLQLLFLFMTSFTPIHFKGFLASSIFFLAIFPIISPITALNQMLHCLRLSIRVECFMIGQKIIISLLSFKIALFLILIYQF